MARPTRPLAILALVTAASIWGLSFVVLKGTLQHISPLHLLALRFLLASVVLIPFGYKQIKTTLKTRSSILVGVILWAALLSQSVGLKETTPSRSAFLTALAVVFVPFIVWITNKRPPAKHSVLGAILAAVGLGILYLPSLGSGPLGMGDGVSILCGFLFGLHFVVAEKVLKEGSATGLALVQNATVLILAAPSFIFVRATMSEFSSSSLLAIAFAGILASGAAFWLQLYAQETISALDTTVVLALEPVIATGASCLLGFERLTASTVIGGLFLIGGAILSQLRAQQIPGDA